MLIKSALILSAGLGTRMGEIGKILPKPLWPLFEKSILQTQIDYLKKIGITNIFVNIHHQRDLIKKEIKNVNFLEEPELLDSGGTLSLLANSLKETILVINCDQFIDFKLEELNLLDCDHLIGIVEAKPTDNRLITKNNYLIKIIPNSLDSNITYSGIALIDLSKINPNLGKAPFFKAIDYTTQRIKTKNITSLYLELGTINSYYHTMFSILNNPHKFFIENKNIITSKATKNGYNSLSSINLGTKSIITNEPIIVIEDTVLPLTKKGIYYKNYFQKIF